MVLLLKSRFYDFKKIIFVQITYPAVTFRLHLKALEMRRDDHERQRRLLKNEWIRVTKLVVCLIRNSFDVLLFLTLLLLSLTVLINNRFVNCHMQLDHYCG